MSPSTRAILAGSLMLFVGLAGLGSPLLASLGSVTLLAVLMLAGGVAEIFGAFRQRGWRNWLVEALLGALAIVAGALLLRAPGEGLVTLTWIAGAYLVVGGILRAAFGGLVAGIATAILGAFVLTSWPTSSTWFIGALVSLRFVIAGGALITLGVTARRVAQVAGFATFGAALALAPIATSAVRADSFAEHLWAEHMASLEAGRLEELAADYTEDAVLVMNGRVVLGRAAVAQTIGGLAQMIAGEGGFTAKVTHADDDSGYMTWTLTSGKAGVDTFVFEPNGQIKLQTVTLRAR